MATWPTVTDDDGTGTTGTILDQALFNSVRDYIGTGWTAVAFSAGNFTASGSMTWTLTSGDQASFGYVEIGKTMIMTVVLVATTTGGTAAADLRVTIPNGRTVQSQSAGSFAWEESGVQSGTGLWRADASQTHIALARNIGGTVWPLATNTLAIYGTFMFHID